MFKKHNSAHFITALIIALISCKSVSSKGYITWYSESDRAIHRISLLNGNYNVFHEYHVDTLAPYELKYEGTLLNLPTNGHHFNIDGELICVFGGVGTVFSLDSTNKVIRRIDKTVHSGYNFDAYQFVRRDTVFSYGGYGF